VGPCGSGSAQAWGLRGEGGGRAGEVGRRVVDRLVAPGSVGTMAAWSR
jgi:hypothetical protein